jgi:flavodoxin
MKVLITYYSETGNTQKIAEAITSIIGEESDLMQMEEVTSFK